MSELIQRFEGAVTTLVGDGPVKQRLAAAFTRYLGELEERDLPPAGRPLFAELHAAVHRVPPVGREGPVKASIQKMSFDEASRHAAAIVRLYAQLAVSVTDRAEPLKVVAPEPPAPRYLTARR